jgi:FAD synthase
MMDGKKISSTRIREALSAGRIDEAERMLGAQRLPCVEK